MKKPLFQKLLRKIIISNRMYAVFIDNKLLSKIENYKFRKQQITEVQ